MALEVAAFPTRRTKLGLRPLPDGLLLPELRPPLALRPLLGLRPLLLRGLRGLRVAVGLRAAVNMSLMASR